MSDLSDQADTAAAAMATVVATMPLITAAVDAALVTADFNQRAGLLDLRSMVDAAASDLSVALARIAAIDVRAAVLTAEPL